MCFTFMDWGMVRWKRGRAGDGGRNLINTLSLSLLLRFFYAKEFLPLFSFSPRGGQMQTMLVIDEHTSAAASAPQGSGALKDA